MILACHNIAVSFAEVPVLRGVSFHIEEHEKAALIGINGAGKSTLLKVIMGELAADEGQVTLAKGARVGYLAQQDMLTVRGTIYEEAAKVRREVFELEDRMHELEEQMKGVSGAALDDLMEQYHLAQARYELIGGYSCRSEIAGVLKGLGFSPDEFDRPAQTLSGGQKTRLALGQLLLSAPDLILLDEPTNHLDVSAVQWLEGYLAAYQGAVLIVSHDRYFLDRVVTKVIEIEHGEAISFSGGYSAFAEKKKQLREAQLRAYLKQQQEIRHQEEVIARLKSFNREKSIKRAESREKMLEKMERLDKPPGEDDALRLRFSPAKVSGRDVLHVEDLAKAFDEPLFSDLSFDIRRGERVALIGDNGTGKSTILKIINGLVDADRGLVTLGTGVIIGYYDQDHQVLHPEKTLFEEVSDLRPAMTDLQIRNLLASFLFTGDDVFKRVKDLSGGERGRLSLALLMLSEANFLILDEPTNHLDIVSKEILEDALREYTGTVFFVSHDRYFINRTATRILELTGQTLIGYAGNYDYYLEKVTELRAVFTGAGQEETRKGAADAAAAAAAGEAPVSAKEAWEKKKEEEAKLRRQRGELKKTEARIESLEERDAEIDALLATEEIYTDPDRLRELSREKAAIGQELAALYERWEALAD